MKIIMVCAAIAVLLATSIAAHAENAREEPIKIEVSLVQTSWDSLKKSADEGNFEREGRFNVMTRIINASEEEVPISLWSCSYGLSWIADTPAIITGLEVCRRNAQFPKVLGPHEVFELVLLIALSREAVPGPLEFKLGFIVDPDPSDRVSSKRTVWSNAITIDITESMLQNLLPGSRYDSTTITLISS